MHSVKSTLVITAAVLLAASAGFWLGSYCTAQTWNHILEGKIHDAAHTANLNRATTNLRLLTYLHEGKQSEASDLLERQLDVALVQCAAYCKTAPPPELVGADIMTIREARDYRYGHPWSNGQPITAQGVLDAFQWAK